MEHGVALLTKLLLCQEINDLVPSPERGLLSFSIHDLPALLSLDTALTFDMLY